ncbi:hypothetical protein WR25_17322 isoform C [Diploscapter pachys]|nr:hypothetical protein WR25_17322 isoform C [Diploscapter pachys]
MERTKYLMGTEKFEMMQNMPLPTTQIRTKMGMATSVDASAIRGVSDLISAHMSQSTTMDVNLANHISNEADWQDEFPSDVEPSPRDLPPKKEDTPIMSEPAAVSPKASDREDEDQQQEQGESSEPLGADLTGTDTSRGSRRTRTATDSSEELDALIDTDLGMGREVENLIKENTELLDMKNALNIVKNDLIARVDELSSENDILREEVRSLEMVRQKMAEQIVKAEEELRTIKMKLAEKETENEEEDVPMAQRKRFTRSEMQRVLIDRNMYKERLMELEESIKWTEMQRARKLQQQQPPPKRGGIWDFFSGLFGDSSPPSQPRRTKEGRRAGGGSNMTRSVEYLDPEMISERRAAERREQYKLVREHVKRDDSGRVEVYGWSLPADSQSSAMVPVPVCCRPLMDNQPSLKVWCATGVTLRGGKDKEGKYIIGQPVYFSSSAKKVSKSTKNGGKHELEDEISRARALDARESELTEWEGSSLIWVGSSNQGKSIVAIMDANNPNNVIETFDASDSHLLCIQGVPGVMENDPFMDEAEAKKYLSGGGKMKDVPEGFSEQPDLGACEWVELRKLDESDDGIPTYCSNDVKPSPKRVRDFSVSEAALEQGTADRKAGKAAKTEETKAAQKSSSARVVPLEKMKAKEGTGKDASTTSPPKVGRAALPPHIRDAMSKYDEVENKTSTALPTVWMGSQNQYIYIHSGITDWKQCILRIKMPDAVLSIVHYKSRVFAALANGAIAIFHRDNKGNWSDAGYHTIRVGKATSSVRSLCGVGSNIWAAYRNCVIVLDAESLQIVKVFSAHPRKDSQVRNMQWIGAGVWLSIRLDSTLRLYHAHTFEHLQDVDIEPFVAKMLGSSRLDFSFIRTTALLVSNRRLWIGTGTGVIISVPLSDVLEQKVDTSNLKKPSVPGGLVRVYSKTEKKEEKATEEAGQVKERTASLGSSNGAFIPYCNLTQAQLSFHGHKDSVKFFLAVPGAPKEGDSEAQLQRMLIISGGDGYIDFRIGEENELEGLESLSKERIRPRDMSHIIIWEIDAALPVVSPAQMGSLRVEHCKKAMEFFIKFANNSKAYLQYQELPNRVLDFQHTVTPPEQQGKGIAKILVEEGFKYAAENNYRIKPTCSYCVKFVEKMATEEQKKLSTTYQSSI